jgi:protein-S-isoprenylcysteine O-methyltransferase
MTGLIAIYFCVLLLMPVIDTVLIRRQRRMVHPGRVYDRRSLVLLWLCAAGGFVAAAGLRTIETIRILLARAIIAPAAIAMMLVGMVLRWLAMIALDGYFSPHVEIAAGQPLITSGIYRHVRHPAYAGIILVFAGIGLAMENWLSLLAVTGLTAAGVANRVRIEEAALREHFGPAYHEYSRRTKRFLPFIL